VTSLSQHVSQISVSGPEENSILLKRYLFIPGSNPGRFIKLSEHNRKETGAVNKKV